VPLEYLQNIFFGSGSLFDVHCFFPKLGFGNIPRGGPREKTAAAREISLENDDDITKDRIKLAAVIPAGLPSVESGSFGPLKLRLGGNDGIAGVHLDLLCQVPCKLS
jgi:hypothetical protein